MKRFILNFKINASGITDKVAKTKAQNMQKAIETFNLRFHIKLNSNGVFNTRKVSYFVSEKVW